MVVRSEKTVLFPITLRDGEVVSDPAELVEVVLRETEQQVADKQAAMDGLDIPDFQLSCDALNYWRVLWRCEVEWGRSAKVDGFRDWFADYLCEAREYDPEEFDLALEAAQERVRVPYGLPPLELAYRQMKRQPIRLLPDELRGKRLLADIAGIAVRLSELEYRSYILLPVENLRQLFNCRKVAITGAIKLLLKHGLLEDTGAKYGTRRARQFHCTAIRGVHYDYEPLNVRKLKPK